MNATLVKATDLQEGMEVTVSQERNDYGIIESAESEWARIGNQTRIRITLTDGREFVIGPNREILVVS